MTVTNPVAMCKLSRRDSPPGYWGISINYGMSCSRRDERAFAPERLKARAWFINVVWVGRRAECKIAYLKYVCTAYDVHWNNLGRPRDSSRDSYHAFLSLVTLKRKCHTHYFYTYFIWMLDCVWRFGICPHTPSSQLWSVRYQSSACPKFSLKSSQITCSQVRAIRRACERV